MIGHVIQYINRTTMADWLGVGRKDALKGANLTDDDLKKLGLELGQYGEFNNHIYRAVTARVALIGEGYLCEGYLPTGTRRDTAVAIGSTTANIRTDNTYVAGRFAGGQVMIYGGTNGATKQDSRFIYQNDAAAGASNIRVTPKRDSMLNLAASKSPDVFTAAIDATSTFTVHCDWEVQPTTAVTDCVMGVALGAVTIDYNTLIMVAGPYAPIWTLGSGAGYTVPAVNGWVRPSAGAGVAEGVTEAGWTGPDALSAFARLYDVYTGAAAIRIGRLYGRYAIGGSRFIYTN